MEPASANSKLRSKRVSVELDRVQPTGVDRKLASHSSDTQLPEPKVQSLHPRVAYCYPTTLYETHGKAACRECRFGWELMLWFQSRC
jgi:hypothetical protein